MVTFLSRVPVSTVLWVLICTTVCLLMSPTPHVLDEETYLWIANEMAWGKPYDWHMPFPPFTETGFVFAHPPLFLWWVKWLGDGALVAIPWLVLWWCKIPVITRMIHMRTRTLSQVKSSQVKSSEVKKMLSNNKL